jgi:hypothetical protein
MAGKRERAKDEMPVAPAGQYIGLWTLRERHLLRWAATYCRLESGSTGQRATSFGLEDHALLIALNNAVSYLTGPLREAG